MHSSRCLVAVRTLNFVCKKNVLLARVAVPLDSRCNGMFVCKTKGNVCDFEWEYMYEGYGLDVMLQL